MQYNIVCRIVHKRIRRDTSVIYLQIRKIIIKSLSKLLTNSKKDDKIQFTDKSAHNYISRSGAVRLARRAHNPKVVGSNPSSATKEKPVKPSV